MSIKALGTSIFNYQDYTVWRFIHYYQQIRWVLKLSPRKLLEVGPGDHMVSDFLMRKGIEVKTLDREPHLLPDYVADLREDLGIHEQFDVVLASEVLEHMNLKWLDHILEKFRKILVSGGHLVVSVPYTTVRLFPERDNYGKIFSCEGRVYTYIPIWLVRLLIDVGWGFYRILFQRCFRSAFRLFKLPDYPDDKVDVHHWDLGYTPTIRKTIRKTFSRHFTVIEEQACYDTNCVFFILKK